MRKNFKMMIKVNSNTKKNFLMEFRKKVKKKKVTEVESSGMKILKLWD